MHLAIRLFASLRERAGGAEVVLSDVAEGTTIGEVIELLARNHPELGSLDHVAAVVGTEYVDRKRELREGEELALLPPVSGGAPEEDERLARGVFELSAEPLDVPALVRRVEHSSCGAVVTFVGNVRHHSRGRDVVRIDYEAFEEMTGAEMERIFGDVRRSIVAEQEQASAVRMLVAHRVGTVPVGQPSVVVAVAAPHRAVAFQAARALIDELKARLPVWKKEVYRDGHHWVGDRS